MTEEIPPLDPSSEPPEDWCDEQADEPHAQEANSPPSMLREVRLWEHESHSEIASAVLAQLAKDNLLLRRGGSVVAVRGWDPDHGPRKTAIGDDGQARPTIAIQRDAPIIRALNGGSLDFEVDHHLQFFVKKKVKDGEEIRRSSCPARVLHMIAGVGGDRILAPIEGILRAPSLRSDGSVITQPGYDPATGYYLATHDSVEGLLSEKPTLDKARRALAALQDLFAPTMPDPSGDGRIYGFPWKRGMVETIVPIALAMTVFARPALVCVPAFAIDASTPGSGKGLTVGLCSILATGEEPARAGWPSAPEEQEKTLGSYALLSPPIIAWDNVRGKIQNEHLENALTTDRYGFRLLGAHDFKIMPFRPIVTFTGNNMQFGGDMPRRLIVARLEPDTEHPDRIPREAFRHPNILRLAREKRAYYAAAILCILRAYVLAGMPSQGLTLGSFSTEAGGLGWVDLIGGALAWVGAGNITDFSAKESADEPEEWQYLRTLLAIWPRLDPDHRGITLATLVGLLYPSDVVELIRKGQHVPPSMSDWSAERAALQGLAHARDRDIPDSGRIGNALRPFRARWFSIGDKRERRFVHAVGADGQPQRPARWKIEER